MKKWICILCLSLLLAGCGNNQDVKVDTTTDVTENTEVVEAPEEATVEEEEVIEEEVVEEEVIETEVVEEEVVEVVDYSALYREYQVNEVGKVIVIMYHNLADKPGDYASTPDLLRADLQRLYDEGYRTVSMSDLVNNTIDIPMGTTPVVLTFDDGSKSNFYYDENGEIAKDSVVGILEAFALEHEDFGTHAIFYLFGENPFREADLIEKKLNYLVDNGYEIGNHSFGHDKLRQLSAANIQKSLAKNEAVIESYVKDYDMIHLSLPYGERPNDERDEALWSGSYEEISYEIVSAVNVGWNPIVSPAHIKFDPKSINRITCGDDASELNYWLDYLKNNPEQRYYSDGDPSQIVVPLSLKDQVKDYYKEQLITYEESEE